MCVPMADGFYILDPFNTTAHHVLSPRLLLYPWNYSYPIEGRLVYADSSNIPANLSGVVLILNFNNLLQTLNWAEKLSGQGLVALVILMVDSYDYPGINSYSTVTLRKYRSDMPVYQITTLANKTLNDYYQNQSTVVFYGDEPNPWHWVFGTWVPTISIILLVTSGINTVIALYKLILLIAQAGGVRLVTAQVVLILNILGMLIRIGWAASDPFGNYVLLPWAVNQIGLTLPNSFIVGSLLLIVLLWHETIVKTGSKINLFLNKMLVPFLVAEGVLIAFELATSIARGRGTGGTLILVNGVVYAVLCIALLVFFLVTGIRLKLVFKSINKRLKTTKKNRLQLASKLIAGVASILLAWFICLILLGLTSLIWTPIGFVVMWTVIMIGVNAMSALQITLIRVPHRPWKWIFCGLCVRDPGALISESYSSSDGSSQPAKSGTNAHSTLSYTEGSVDLQTTTLGEA